MSVKQKVAAFIEDLAGEHKLFPYLYNARRKSFNKDKDWVFYSGPTWDNDEAVSAISAFLTGKWLVSGEHVAQFEHRFSKKFGHAASVMVNSGSSANLAMVAALKKFCNWQDGDEVIVSTVGFPTTIAPLMQNGLVPALVDISFDDLNFDLDQVAAKVGTKTKAIFISPVLGNAPDMDRLEEIAKSHDILLVLDNCDSLGSKWKGKDLSDYSFCSSTSFYPAHHMTTGEGGMVSSKNEEFITLARSIAWWGRDCYCVGSANLLCEGTCGKRFDKWLPDYDGQIDHKYLFANVGYNLKPLDLQGAIGSQQLKKFDSSHELRRANKDTIGKLFEKHIPGARVLAEHEHAETGWFGTPIVCPDKDLKQRLVQHLETNRIQTRNYFAGNILLHPGYRHLDDFRSYPEANKVLDQVFFVGCHPTYKQDVFDYVDEVLGRFES